MTYLAGIVVLLFTLADIRRGESDLLCWMRHWGIEVNREENGIFFWLAIVLQLLVGIGLLLLGWLLQGIWS